MQIHQLSVFLENKPHQVRLPARLLGEAGIDILALSLADTEQFGILRMIVDDWEKAWEVLSDAGCVVKVTEVVAIEIPDHPGGLAAILETTEKADLDIEYMYAFTFRCGDKALLVFRFAEEMEHVIASLRAHGVDVVQKVDLLTRQRK